jgi:hypothetical protein
MFEAGCLEELILMDACWADPMYVQVLFDQNANIYKLGFGISAWTLHVGTSRLKRLCLNWFY